MIYTHGIVIPDAIFVTKADDFELARNWYDWLGQHLFQGLRHEDPRNHIKVLEDEISSTRMYEYSEDYILSKKKYIQDLSSPRMTLKKTFLNNYLKDDAPNHESKLESML